MKKILFIYPGPTLGGSTYSFLTLLDNLNYQKNDVTILLFSDKVGDISIFLKYPVKTIVLNDELNVHKKKLINPICYLIKIVGFLGRIFKKKNLETQLMRKWNCLYRSHIHNYFDVAVSYLENDSTYYNYKYIKAKMKICWLHVNYTEAGFLSSLDKKMYSSFDKIACVSEASLASFVHCFPKLVNRCFFIPNIIDKDMIRKKSNEPLTGFKIDDGFVNLLTCCRIDLFHKGLDRTFYALNKIKKETGLNIRWYIIGKGKDDKKIRKLLNKLNLCNDVFLLGPKSNPYPYFRLFDYLFVPSRYEGKPIVVEEALICQLPVIATNYSSAKSQIGDNGLVIDNTFQGIYVCLKELNKGNRITFERQKIGSNVDEKESIKQNLLFILGDDYE